MRKLTAMSFVSLDGVMQGPGGPDEDRTQGFEHGGWAVPHFDQDTLDVITALTRRGGALLLGRRTYETFAATWPLAEADDPVGAKLNAMPKYVASRTLDTVTWTNSTLLTGDVQEAVRELKRADGDEIQVHGSPGLLQTLLAHDLVDEFVVFTFPVLIGSGTRLFGDGTAPGRLRLTDVTGFGGGVVAGTYVRDGKLEYGAMGPETGNW
ncbi:dihydrofolate reductase family protein [Actinophytocola algeriensis]|uniref:Dihydrofolate reductase n=1 Tax=Actinophytocola algeriensis TaxID=1768010 RepID=A0A7W7VD08_9PSEU|nr:dihydrofolate reductase family protein [Actinophytocola algeriensis]MBB4905671.1 dihydrofolate reductase [Actinophytocola algeriensis]MBE1472644.1 dihydrofolate reductase [Actinophytocola algeriensis]